MPMKLGKLPARPDPRDIKFSAISAGLTLPTAPARFGHGTIYKDWKMLGNDRYGDCVFAGGAHETMLSGKLSGVSVVFTDAAVLSDYSAVTGFDPEDPSTDQGAYVADALRYRRRTGMVDGKEKRHKIGAYVSIDPKNWELLMTCVYVFSAVGIGFEFPASAMDQYNAGETWDVVEGSSIEGGHYVPVMGRSSRSVGGCVTWGKRQGFSKAFYQAYNDESWAIVYPEELRAGKTERGMDLTQLNAALKSL